MSPSDDKDRAESSLPLTMTEAHRHRYDSQACQLLAHRVGIGIRAKCQSDEGETDARVVSGLLSLTNPAAWTVGCLVRFRKVGRGIRVTDMVKVFGCRPSQVTRRGMGRRTKTAQARTRGAAAMVYGDCEFWLVAVMAKSTRCWCRRGLDECDLLPGGV